MKTNKKELTVFALCAYAIPFLMMPLLYICLQNERDTSIFANAQMFYPAAGVMLAWQNGRICLCGFTSCISRPLH